jgi:hypothetical protein
VVHGGAVGVARGPACVSAAAEIHGAYGRWEGSGGRGGGGCLPPPLSSCVVATAPLHCAACTALCAVTPHTHTHTHTRVLGTYCRVDCGCTRALTETRVRPPPPSDAPRSLCSWSREVSHWHSYRAYGPPNPCMRACAAAVQCYPHTIIVIIIIIIIIITIAAPLRR